MAGSDRSGLPRRGACLLRFDSWQARILVGVMVRHHGMVGVLKCPALIFFLVCVPKLTGLSKLVEQTVFPYFRETTETVTDQITETLLVSLRLDDLRKCLREFMLRRRTDEVLEQLPEKIEHDVEVELGEAQRQAYDLAESQGIVELNAQGDRITVFEVLHLITKLRQICNFDPASGDSAKLEHMLEDLEEITASGRKTLVFSQFVDGSFGLKRVAGRLPAVWNALQLHGDVSPSKRDGIVRSFNHDPDPKVLLLNFKVGGVGLNLQAANYVYLFDRWWNPAVEDQAVKRAHRLGQKSKVFVRRYVCAKTIEERIVQKLAEKRRLFSQVIDEGRPAEAMGLTEEELFSLFNLKVPPRRRAAEVGPTRLVLENMDATQFETLVEALYQRQGYDVTRTGGSHDGGIDVLAEKRSAAGSEKLAIQCKHQIENVGRPILQALWGVVNHDQRFTQGVLVTSASFSREAREFAQGKRLTLIDRVALKELVEHNKVAQFVPGTVGLS